MSRYIDSLMRERGIPQLDRHDLANLTAPRASELIEHLKAGTYDPTEWDVPF